MTVHINGSKGKDLYYGGTKIKEVYYGSTKVYSSGPLYYCYRSDPYGLGIYAYHYLLEKPTKTGSITYYYKKNFVQASSSNELNNSIGVNVTKVTDSSFDMSGSGGGTSVTCYYYPSGDLYT